MKCDAYRALIDEFETGELTGDEIELLLQHLAECDDCRAYQEGGCASDEETAENAPVPGEHLTRPDPVARPVGERSWVLPAAAAVVLAALVGLLLILGSGWRSRRGGAHGGAGVVDHGGRHGR